MIRAQRKPIYQWNCGLQGGIFRHPDSQVFVDIEILKAPVSESIPVRAAWPLPLFGSHSIGSFKNFCLQTEITAPTSDKHQRPFIMNTHQALSNLTQTTAVLELA